MSDDFDPFAEQTEEEKKAVEAKTAEVQKKINEKQANTKSQLILLVKPWEADQSLQEIANKIKSVVIEGLLWGAFKEEEVAYGVKQLVVMATIEDSKVSSQDIEDVFSDMEDLVQSMDIRAWNKL